MIEQTRFSHNSIAFEAMEIGFIASEGHLMTQSLFRVC